MMRKKTTIIIGLILLTAAGAYAANAAGLVLFGGNSYQGTDNGLVLNMSLAQDNYNSGTKTFTDNASGNNGVSANAANFVPDNYGKSTGAMSFNGTTDYINVGNSSIYNLQAGATVSIWVKIPSTWSGNTYPNLVSKGASAGWDTDGWSIYAFSNNSIGIGMRNGGTTFIRSFANTVKDQWTNIVGTWDGTTVTLYQDGIYKASATQTIVPAVNTTNVIIGRGPSSQYFGGNIGTVKIYNRALSSAEVRALYNSSKPKVTGNSIQSGLVGYWPLDGDNFDSTSNRVTDKTPYENHGTNYGATLTTDRNGQANGAMSFDGATNSIRMGNSASGILDFGTGDFTLSAWLKTPLFPNTWKSIIFKGASGNPGYGMEISSSNTLTCSINAIGGSNQHYGAVNVLVGEWQHFVCVFDRDNKIFGFLNGNLIGSGSNYAAGNTNSISNGNQFVIGSYGGGSWNINGSISDVRIYNRALSTSEVNALYNSNKPKIVSDSLQKGLVLDMPLNSSWTKTETAGSQIMVDKTPYSNNGQNNGATVGTDSTSFDGINDVITTSPSESLNIDDKDFTFSTWFNIPTGAQVNWAGVMVGSSYGYGYELSGGRFFSGVGAPFYINFTSSIPRDRWYNVVATHNSQTNTGSVFIDGNFISSASYAGNLPVSNHILQIGGNDNINFIGSISNIKIYNRVLSNNEIKSLYDKGR